jgi:hypothetical protein
MENWKIRIVDGGARTARQIFIMQKDPSGKTLIWRNDKVETLELGQWAEPSFWMEPEMLQDFANALNDIGIKPEQGFLEGKLGATEKHLEDMRTLVFQKKD